MVLPHPSDLAVAAPNAAGFAGAAVREIEVTVGIDLPGHSGQTSDGNVGLALVAVPADPKGRAAPTSLRAVDRALGWATPSR